MIAQQVRSGPSPLLAFAVVLVAHGAFVLIAGFRHAPDTAYFVEVAEDLVASGFNYVEAAAQNQTRYPAILYSGFVTLVAVLQLAFGSGWPVALVVLNVIAQAGTAALVVRTAREATGSGIATWAALAVFLLLFDLFNWTRFLLSDTGFVLLSFTIWALVAKRMLTRDGSWLPIVGLTLFAAFYRPTGVLLAPVVGWAWFLAHTHSGRLRKTATAGAVIVGAAGALLFGAIMQQPDRWPFGLSGTIEATARGYVSGEVVLGRLETYHGTPTSLLDYLAIIADRFVHFFAFAAADFSLSHTALNALFFVPLYALAAWLALALLRRRHPFREEQRDLFLATFAYIAATALFHALLQVDFDWRYRAPVLPHLILLAAGGTALVAQGVCRRAPAVQR